MSRSRRIESNWDALVGLLGDELGDRLGFESIESMSSIASQVDPQSALGLWLVEELRKRRNEFFSYRLVSAPGVLLFLSRSRSDEVLLREVCVRECASESTSLAEWSTRRLAATIGVRRWASEFVDDVCLRRVAPDGRSCSLTSSLMLALALLRNPDHPAVSHAEDHLDRQRVWNGALAAFKAAYGRPEPLAGSVSRWVASAHEFGPVCRSALLPILLARVGADTAVRDLLWQRAQVQGPDAVGILRLLPAQDERSPALLGALASVHAVGPDLVTGRSVGAADVISALRTGLSAH